MVPEVLIICMEIIFEIILLSESEERFHSSFAVLKSFISLLLYLHFVSTLKNSK